MTGERGPADGASGGGLSRRVPDRDHLAELFERALALPGAERDAFLSALHEDDVELHAELVSLLASHEAAPAFLERLGSKVLPAALAVFREQEMHGGRVAGRYQIMERLGIGGMGVVYRAIDVILNRPVALKFLPARLSADPLARSRLVREARAASALDHPGIAVIHEIGVTDASSGGMDADRLFITMGYYPGETLKQRIARGRIAVTEALEYAIQLADALGAAHQAGIIHRDVKPGNVLITDAGQVKLVDFGVAKVTGAEVAHEPATTGTIAYMSPEQTRGEPVDQRTDIWSLGVVLHEMFTGVRPFTGETDAVVRGIRSEEPVSPAAVRKDVSPRLASVVSRCLAKDAEHRYPSMAELHVELVEVAKAWTPATALASNPARREGEQRSGQRIGRPRLGALGGATLLLLLVVGLPLRLGQDDGGYPTRTPVLVADFFGSAEEGHLAVARNIVSTVLEQSAVVAPVPRAQIERGLALAQRPETTRVDEALARELAMRGGIGPIVVGQLDRVGQSSVLILRAEVAESGTPIVTQRVVAQTSEQLIAAVEGAARRLRDDLAGRRERIPRGGLHFEVMTHSLPAYLKYVEGIDHHSRRRDWIASIESQQEAIRLDPDFAEAWVQVGAAYFNRGMPDSAMRAYGEALRRPGRFTTAGLLEAEGITAHVTGDLREAYRRYDQLRRHDGVCRHNLGVILRELGRPAEALEVYECIAELSGPAQLTLSNRVYLLLEDLGRHEEALELAEQLESPYDRAEIRLLHALLTTDWSLADSIAGEVISDVLAPAMLVEHALVVGASVHAARGAAAAAYRDLGVASAMAARAGRPDRLRRNELSRLVLAFAAPDVASDARPVVEHDAEDPLAMAHRAIEEAMMGDTVVARKIIGNLRELPPERRLRGAWPKLLEASLLARAGRWADVPVRLYRANPGPARDEEEFLLVWWLLADAYERLGEPDSAAVYLNLLGDAQAVARIAGSVSRNPGSSFIGFSYPYAHQRLAALHARAGRMEDARLHWQRFVQQFTNPDSALRHLIDTATPALVSAGRD